MSAGIPRRRRYPYRPIVKPEALDQRMRQYFDIADAVRRGLVRTVNDIRADEAHP